MDTQEERKGAKYLRWLHREKDFTVALALTVVLRVAPKWKDTWRVRYEWHSSSYAQWDDETKKKCTKWAAVTVWMKFIVISISQWVEALVNDEMDKKRERKKRKYWVRSEWERERVEEGGGWNFTRMTVAFDSQSKAALSVWWGRVNVEHPSTLTVWPSDFYFRSNEIQRAAAELPVIL